LAQAIFREGPKNVTAGVNLMAPGAASTRQLPLSSTRAEEDERPDGARKSRGRPSRLNNDKEIGDLIAEAMRRSRRRRRVEEAGPETTRRRSMNVA
jgi:hypothetical protein